VVSAADHQRFREASVDVPPIGLERADFTSSRMGDRFTALSALREGRRIAKDEPREPGREDRCHGFVNGCRCNVCRLPTPQRQLRIRLKLIPGHGQKEDIAA
jgi:hypothetical protein